MNYIYDIYLNFNQDYFDFYDWLPSDTLTHIKKIPLVRVNTGDFKTIISSNIELDSEELNDFTNHTELYHKVNHISALILTDTKNAIALKLNDKGLIYERSSLVIDDEFDVLHFSLKIHESHFKFKILNKLSYTIATRKEISEQNYLLKHLHKLSYDTLKYMYYDCFNKEGKNKETILTDLKEEIKNNFVSVHHMYNILNPISIK